MIKWEKCAFETCTNEVTAIGKKYCGRKDCPKIEDDKVNAARMYQLKYKAIGYKKKKKTKDT